MCMYIYMYIYPHPGGIRFLCQGGTRRLRLSPSTMWIQLLCIAFVCCREYQRNQPPPATRVSEDAVQGYVAHTKQYPPRTLR